MASLRAVAYPLVQDAMKMTHAIPSACLARSAIRCRNVETGSNLGVLAVFPANGIVRLRVQVAQWTDEQPGTELSRLPIPA